MARETDIIALQLNKLLRPFENQSGIVGTNTGNTMMNNIPLINTADILNQYNIPNLRSQNLMNEIIKQNLPNTVNTFNTTDTADTASFFFPPNNQIVPLKKPTRGIVDSTIASNLLYDDLPLSRGIDTSYGVANEPDEEQVKSLTEPTGIAKLFKFISNISPFGLARRGLESLRGLNQRIQQSDFAQSKTLMDYLDARKYGGRQARDDARARTMAQARGIQKKIDRGEFNRDTSKITDRGRGSIPTRSKPTRSRSTSQGGMRAERTRSRDLGRMRGGVGR